MHKIPAWVAGYLDIPFVEAGRDRLGADCYGLVRLVLAEQFGVAIPLASAGAWTSDLDKAGRADLAARVQAVLADWREVPRDRIAPGDVLLLRVEGRPLHVGVALDGAGAFLHTEIDIGPHIADWNGARWSRRVLGFYRWGAVS
jgi:cell wall-associated NlpC family hydrolase